jgi:hypothetical protein
MELLQPKAAANLRHCDILVEMHDHLVPDATATMIERFHATHDITQIHQTDRNPCNYPVLKGLDIEDQLAALSEWRPKGQQWLFLRSKISAAA